MTVGTTERAAQLERMFRDHADAVRRYAAMRVDTGAVDDVVADTFLVAWRRIHVVPAESLPWLLGVARKVVSTHLRGRGRRSALVDRLEDQMFTTLDNPVSEEVEQRRILVEGLRDLSVDDQELLLTWAWYDLSASDGATVFGCSTGAYTVRLHRARRRLSRSLSRTLATPEQSHSSEERA